MLAPPDKRQSCWQSMETAPKDGRPIDLVYPYPRGRVIDCFWDEQMGGWGWVTPIWENGALLPKTEWPYNCYPNMEPLGWMPAPKLPGVA